MTGTEISDLTYLVGSPEMVLDVAQYSIEPFNADRQLTFTISALPPTSFVSVDEPSPGVFKVKVMTANPADTGIYAIEVKCTESFSGLTHT